MRQWIWVCLGMILLTLATFDASAAGPKRVLILTPFGRDVAPFSAVVSSFRTTLARELGEPVDFYEVPLDLARVSGAQGEAPLVSFLQDRLKNQPVDLVATVGSSGVQFAARHREELFPNSPVLVIGADPRMLPPGFMQTNATLVTAKVNLPEMVEDILQMQPQTTNIVVVFGTSAVETFWVRECRHEFQSFTNRVGFTWLDHLALGQLLERCAALPPRSFILNPLFVVDAAGVPNEKNEELHQLHEVANAPIFGLFESEFGLGPVGGRLYPDVEVGNQGARTAIRILHGERPESIPPQVLAAAAPVYDWRELRRWGIREANLPAGSTIRFRVPGVWELYRWWVIGTVAFCLFQTALIAALLLSRAKQRQGEAKVRQLSHAIEQSPALITITDTQAKITYVNRKFSEVTGFSLEECLGQNPRILKSGESPPATYRELWTLITSGQTWRGEFHNRKKNGELYWEWAVISPLRDAAGQITHYVAVKEDITERKQTEATMRDLSRRLIRGHEAERARLGRELHDDVTQRLAVLAIDAGRAEIDAKGMPMAETMRTIREGLATLSEDIHALSYRLHPALLEDLGLAEALKAECERFSRQEAIPADVTLRDLPEAIPPETALCLFRVAQEALRNTARHAKARRVEISMRPMNGGLQLVVQDDGVGFEPAVQGARPSLGLASMRERVLLVDGEIEIESAPGRATTILVTVPLNKG